MPFKLVANIFKDVCKSLYSIIFCFIYYKTTTKNKKKNINIRLDLCDNKKLCDTRLAQEPDVILQMNSTK